MWWASSKIYNALVGSGSTLLWVISDQISAWLAMMTSACLILLLSFTNPQFFLFGQLLHFLLVLFKAEISGHTFSCIWLPSFKSSFRPLQFFVLTAVSNSSIKTDSFKGVFGLLSKLSALKAQKYRFFPAASTVKL